MGTITAHNITDIITQYGIKTFIETGTGHGAAVKFCVQFPFEDLHTVEIDQITYDENIKPIEGFDPRVKFYLDNSANFLTKLLTELPKEKPILFFLDAHYPGCWYRLATQLETEKDLKLRIPLENEGNIIASLRPEGKDVIIIDDLRIYEDGPYEDGNWVDRAAVGADNIQFMFDTFGKTHNVTRDFRHQGYLVITPKTS